MLWNHVHKENMNITKEQLENLYIGQNLTIRQCAEVLGLPTSGGISWRLKKFGILARLGKFQAGISVNKGRNGEKANGWKGGKKAVSCTNCGKELLKFPSLIRENNFCNQLCTAEWRAHDMAGKRVGILTVIKQTGRDKHDHILWECLCDCRNIVIRNTSDLGIIKSCGCLLFRSGEKHPAWKGGKIEVKCANSNCNNTKWVSRSHEKLYSKFFCNDKCRGVYMSTILRGDNNPKWKPRIEVECAYCGNPLEILPCIDKLYKNHFCKGTDCMSKWNSENRKGKANANYKGGTPERRKIRSRISAAMRKAIKQNKAGRHWEEFVDYGLDDLIKRLKSTIPDGYSWEDDLVNGNNVLHIDHIIPMVAFNFDSADHMDFKRCFALNNLQLLPAIENDQKSAKLIQPFQPSLALEFNH